MDATKGVDKRGSVKKHSGAVGSDKEEKRKQSKVSLMDACPAVRVQHSDAEQGALSDSENLALRFKIYEASQKYVAHILSFWDRVQGILLSPLNQAEVRHKAEARRQPALSHRSQQNRGKEHQVTLEKECRKKERLEESVKKERMEKESTKKERLEKEGVKKERLEKDCSKKERVEKKRTKKERLKNLEALEDSALSELEGEGAEGSCRGQRGRVPCLTIEALGSEDVTRKILESSKLPVAEQVKPCEAQVLSLPCSALVHCVPRTRAQSLDQATVPQRLRSSPVAGEVLTIPQTGAKRECSLFKHPVRSVSQCGNHSRWFQGRAAHGQCCLQLSHSEERF
ncbi:hypothetical protein FK515_28275, partial [Klebsiella pneumoniae]|nr:hypothetical protein [Klebsiella pneumoniae]